MEKCNYEELATTDNSATIWNSRKPFLKQLFICTGVWTCYFQSGLCFGAPTVFIPQVRQEFNTTTISEDTASWLAAAYNLGGLPWIICLPLLSRLMGRRRCFILVSANTLAGFIILYHSKTASHLLLGQALQGLLNASTVTLSLMIVTEYTSPNNRGLFLTLKTATFVWGLWVSNAIGTFSHWRNISIVGMTCSLYSLICVISWPESPYWLAARGRIEECAAAHIWLKGSDYKSMKELDSLIKSQSSKSECQRNILRRLFRLVVTKEFYKPIALCALILAQYNFSGKLICSVYAIEIIKNITNSESTAYIGMLILDGITVLGTYSGCILSKYCPRRTILLVASSFGITFLFLISLYLYLVELAFVSECKYVSIILLIGFSISISCGPMILATSLCGELLPLRSRTFSIIVIGSTGNGILGVLVKISPYIFNTFQMHGAFLFYGVSTMVFSILIYIYLPETKDKTLQEISECISGVPNNEKEELKKLPL